jgi:ssDNA-binding Zn-finger/Zn-ribbon topoisomerase 1
MNLDSILSDLKKQAKKSQRFITCQICGKTITKKRMAKHFIIFHA